VRCKVGIQSWDPRIAFLKIKWQFTIDPEKATIFSQHEKQSTDIKGQWKKWNAWGNSLL
jgi:phage baseplate assembly protein W